MIGLQKGPILFSDDEMNKPYNVEELEESCDGISSTERSQWQMFELNWTTNDPKSSPLYMSR